MAIGHQKVIRSRVLCLTAALALGACGGTPGSQEGTGEPVADATTTTAQTSTWDTTKPFAGFSLSPLSYDETGFEDFFVTASSSGSLVAWVGSWLDLEQGGTLVYELAGEHGYVPIAVTGFASGEKGGRIIPDDPQQVVDTISQWVADHPVPYLGFGVETDTHIWEHSEAEFERYAEIFSDVVEAVHSVSPNTLVFPGFQLERVRGLKGGLFNEEDTDPVWELFEMFPDADAIGFTTYPGLVFTDPAEMPDDYYAEIEEHVDLPIVFSELGWQAGGDLADWSGTAEKQARFVEMWVPELVLRGDMVVWSFLWDQPRAPRAFVTMGLIDDRGAKRPAFDTWTELVG